MKEGKSADNHHRTQRIFLFKLNFEFPVCFFYLAWNYEWNLIIT